jgi:ubiquinol-cytochrome c reductase cytochrome c subunit
MKRIVAIVLLALPLPLAAQSPAGDAARGKAAYMKQGCYTCHGTVGQGGDRGSGPRIAYDAWPWEAFAQQTRRPRESMPRYAAELLPDAELADIYAYVAGQKRGPKAAEIPLLKE